MDIVTMFPAVFGLYASHNLSLQDGQRFGLSQNNIAPNPNVTTVTTIKSKSSTPKRRIGSTFF